MDRKGKIWQIVLLVLLILAVLAILWFNHQLTQTGIVLRISLDVMTGGASEIVMVALDVNRAAMDYRKASGGKGTAYGYFKAMAVPLVFGVGIGVVAAVGRGASKAIGTAAKKLAPVKTAALMEKGHPVRTQAVFRG